MARVSRLAGGWGERGGTAGFSGAPRCLIRQWGELDRWDSILSSEIANAQGLPCVALGKLLTEQVLPVDGVPFDQLQTISISFKGIVTRRSVAAGQEYSMRLKFAPPGSIVASKIDLKNSALGVVGDDIKNAVVTSHFVVYEPSDDLIPEYLHLLMQTQKLKNWLRLARSGTDGRTEVKLDAFNKLKVPLPSVDDQRALVAAYYGALGQAAALEAEAAELETAGLRAFESALGIVPPPPVPDRPLFVARFSDLARWSHEAVLRRVTGTEPPPSPYPIVALEDVIADLENGWSPQCLTRPADGEEWGVLKVSAVSSGTFKAGENKALPPQLKPRANLEVKVGDILIARASGAASLVGRCCYVDATQPRLMICDKIFRVIPIASAPVDLRFLAQVLRTDHVRRQILGEFSTESGMMKNVTKPVLLSLTFPMPTDLAVQTALVADLTTAQTAAGARRGQALTMRRDAWRAFETAIYGDASEPLLIDTAEDEAEEASTEWQD